MVTPSEPPSLLAIFLAFSRIGVTSFGGGLSGWMMREFVRERRWIGEQEFLSGLALSQGLPGINVVNLAIWIGYKLRGGGGAMAASFGMVLPAMVVALLMAMVFAQFSQSHTVHLVLAGIAAAAIGLSLEMGLRAARHAASGIVPVAIMAATFVAIFVFEVNLIVVVCIAAPAAIAAAWFKVGPQDDETRP